MLLLCLKGVFVSYGFQSFSCLGFCKTLDLGMVLLIAYFIQS